jgi:glycosyltransferase involved in cell wall biosynthesis
MEKLLSIVIPVYKVEKYIEKCISSLLVPDNQQLQLLDIVVINDGTPDNSAIFAKAYEKQYPGIVRVIDQENRGHGGAWNHGTELAVGKYLFYLDSDDWFETSEFSRLIDFLKTCETDMVMLDSQKYYAETDRYEDTNRHIELEPEIVYDADTFDWLGTGHGYDMTYAHDCVYRTAMMQAYLPLFCEHVMYDDVSLQGIPIAIAKDFIYTKLNVYRYYIGRPGQSFDPKVRAFRAADDVTKVLKFLLDWTRRNHHVVPKGGTREAYTEENYQSMGYWHYYELSLFDAATAKPRLEAWDKFLKENYPEIKPNHIVRMYHFLPFFLYFSWFKCYFFTQRVIRYTKRKLKRK